VTCSGRARAVRLAASVALLAFALLPHGHLRGHQEVASARALAVASAPALGAAPLAAGHAAAPRTCSLCLSLARVRAALAGGAGPALPLATPAERIGAPPPPLRAAAPTLAHASPRAPPGA
jgi:hypothetical protein